ncbi:hypothetical protein KKG71_05060 [Patescibacteria group bacterium]|nr:hypothetical protein [Patescibacteria group bacterium]
MIIATTTKFDYETVSDIRLQLTLRTFELAKIYGYKVVAVDSNSDDFFLERANVLGVKIFEQKQSGMGNARREAIMHAINTAASIDSFIVWIEPEKCNIINHLSRINEYEQANHYELILFYRKSLESYPREQQLSYSYGRLLSEYLLGQSIDLFYGPVAFRKRSIEYFTNYVSSYSDKWDSIHIPKLRIIAAHIPFTQITIDYSHPFEQTSSEMGNLDLFLKRTEQAHELSIAYIAEAKKLGLIHN